MPSITPPAVVWRRVWRLGPIRFVATDETASGLRCVVMGRARGRRWSWRVDSRWSMFTTAATCRLPHMWPGCPDESLRTLKEACRAAEAAAAALERENPRRPGLAICGTPFIKEWMAERDGEPPTDKQLAEFIKEKLG